MLRTFIFKQVRDAHTYGLNDAKIENVIPEQLMNAFSMEIFQRGWDRWDPCGAYEGWWLQVPPVLALLD